MENVSPGVWWVSGMEGQLHREMAVAPITSQLTGRALPMEPGRHQHSPFRLVQLETARGAQACQAVTSSSIHPSLSPTRRI